jgi:hypothetical protein
VTISLRLSLIIAVGIAATVAVALQAPIPQPSAYHALADQRRLLGVPNFWNVASNLPFLLIGLAGIRELASRCPRGALPTLRPAYICFFLGVTLVGLGSAYYHLAPSNDTLTWDRLPMSLVSMAFFSIIVGEHVSPQLGRRLLGPLLLLGLASVAYWHFTEQVHRGDLRPYVLVQFLPLALAPLILLLFPSQFSRTWFLWALLGVYGLAKLSEEADQLLFSFGQIVSGHTLKHFAAAFALYLFLLALKFRRPVPQASSVQTVAGSLEC